MSDWLLNLPVLRMAVVVFGATYLIAGGIYLLVTELAVNERARAFKAVSSGMLPTLGTLFALLIGFIAVEVWSDFDKAKVAVATEASALRAVVSTRRNFPRGTEDAYLCSDQPSHRGSGESRMARDGAPASDPLAFGVEALHEALALKHADDSQRTAQPEMVRALRAALGARRQRIVISESSVGAVKWVGILLQGLCTLGRYCHGSQRQPAHLRLFATGIALSVLLIAAYSRPFTGEISDRTS